MATVVDLGKKLKAKHPGAYDDLSDAEAGQRLKAKHPGDYDDFSDIPQGMEKLGNLPGPPAARLPYALRPPDPAWNHNTPTGTAAHVLASPVTGLLGIPGQINEWAQGKRPPSGGFLSDDPTAFYGDLMMAYAPEAARAAKVNTGNFAQGALKSLREAPPSVKGQTVGRLVGWALGGKAGSAGGALRALEGSGAGAYLGGVVGAKVPAIPEAIRAGARAARDGGILEQGRITPFDPANYMPTFGSPPLRPPVNLPSSTIPFEPGTGLPPIPPAYDRVPVQPPLRSTSGTVVPAPEATSNIPITKVGPLPEAAGSGTPLRPPVKLYPPSSTVPFKPAAGLPPIPPAYDRVPVRPPIRSTSGTVVPIPESTSDIPVAPVGPLPETPGSGTPVRPPVKVLSPAEQRQAIVERVLREKGLTGITPPPPTGMPKPPAPAPTPASAAPPTVEAPPPQEPPAHEPEVSPEMQGSSSQVPQRYYELSTTDPGWEHAMAKDRTIAKHLKSQGITGEDWLKMDVDEQNGHVKAAGKAANKNYKPLGKGGARGRSAQDNIRHIYETLNELDGGDGK